MMEHHKQTIDKVIDHFKDDKRFLAVIIGGSVVKHLENADSDIDIMLIATDEEYKKRTAKKDYHIVLTDICDYEGGYVDGKVYDLQFLREAADHGSEPARFAFINADVVICRDPEIKKLLHEIAVYPQEDRSAKIASFHAQVRVMLGFIFEAEKRGDKYFLVHAVKELVLFGGRMILAHNNILFPYHKWFMHELRNAPDKPDNIVDLAETLLEKPCKANADLFAECVLGFKDWPMPQPNEWIRFMEDSEWNWRYGRAPVQDC